MKDGGRCEVLIDLRGIDGGWLFSSAYLTNDYERIRWNAPLGRHGTWLRRGIGADTHSGCHDGEAATGGRRIDDGQMGLRSQRTPDAAHGPLRGSWRRVGDVQLGYQRHLS